MLKKDARFYAPLVGKTNLLSFPEFTRRAAREFRFSASVLSSAKMC